MNGRWLLPPKPERRSRTCVKKLSRGCSPSLPTSMPHASCFAHGVARRGVRRALERGRVDGLAAAPPREQRVQLRRARQAARRGCVRMRPALCSTLEEPALRRASRPRAPGAAPSGRGRRRSRRACRRSRRRGGRARRARSGSRRSPRRPRATAAGRPTRARLLARRCASRRTGSRRSAFHDRELERRPAEIERRARSRGACPPGTRCTCATTARFGAKPSAQRASGRRDALPAGEAAPARVRAAPGRRGRARSMPRAADRSGSRTARCGGSPRSPSQYHGSRRLAEARELGASARDRRRRLHREPRAPRAPARGPPRGRGRRPARGPRGLRARRAALERRDVGDRDGARARSSRATARSTA